MTLFKNSNKNTFILNLNVQYENAGDLLINKCLITELRKYGQPIINISGMPKDFLDSLELEKKEGVKKIRFLFFILAGLFQSLFRTHNIYIFSGPGHAYGTSLSYALRLLRFGLYWRIFRLFGVKTIKAACSAGPFSQIVKNAERFCATAFQWFLVRDSISLSYCKKLGIKCEYFPDLSYLTNIKFEKKKLYSEEYVVLSFRESSHGLDSTVDYAEKLFQKMDRLLENLHQSSISKIVISYQVSRDRDFCLKFKERYSRMDYEVIFHNEKLNVEKALSLYSQAKFIFSNRLHVLLLGLISGSLPLAIIDKERHHKITGIYIDEQLEDCIADIYKTGDEMGFLEDKYKNHTRYIEKMALIKNKRHREIQDKFETRFSN